MIQSRGEKIFSLFNYALLSLIGIAALYPFIYVLAASFSNGEAVVQGEVWLYPIGVNLEAYKKVFTQEGLWLAYGNTVFYTVVGTLFSLVITVLGAFPLSRRRLAGRTYLNMMVAFTLLFSAGMIPSYLNLRDLELLNTRTGIIVAFAVSTFLVIVMRTFFQSIPDEMEEAATVDGASTWQILWHVFIPLSKPALAAVGLFYAVGRWNGYFWAMIMLRDEDKIPLQVLLTKLIVSMRPNDDMIAMAGDIVSYNYETVVYATIVVAIGPIIALYPFLQKYFVKGVMIGSLKG